ncbi:hypothetical protein [Spiroplasma endosymbiont of Crioceris asparagi]|uniref:hypothetical protein n=1 Tax=Spiroplasma endosymbiont of Crioceris asparagi TaxID=3066286 RepID=UPI0030D1FE53
MKYGMRVGYVSKLNNRETIKAINEIKNYLYSELKSKYNLVEFQAALATDKNLWLNDDFRLSERPVDFDAQTSQGFGEMLISANKWRRYFLYQNEFEKGEGVINTFSCIRRNAELSRIKSLTYNEIGFELIESNYDIEVVQDIQIEIYKIFKKIDSLINLEYSNLNGEHFTKTLSFVTYSKLRKLYPFLNYREMLNRFGRENGSFVLTNFVKKTINSSDATQYSNDVFDFETLTKLYIYNKEIEESVSVSYCGFQVEKKALKDQNLISKEERKINTLYNHLIKVDKLPQTISCGVYIDKLTMLILEKSHIAEVHSSLWDDDFIEYCEKNEIKIF